MYLYTLRVITAWLANLMNLPGKMDGAPAEEDSPSLVEEIPSEAMDSTSCKLLLLFVILYVRTLLGVTVRKPFIIVLLPRVGYM